MAKTKKCFECGKEFEVSPRARYMRKYCPECSEKRKKMWDEQWKVKFDEMEDEDD
jgi:predicted  nucleic acid-binding Zn-ribbon protein